MSCDMERERDGERTNKRANKGERVNRERTRAREGMTERMRTRENESLCAAAASRRPAEGG